MKFVHMVNTNLDEYDPDGNYWMCKDCESLNEDDQMEETSNDPYDSIVCHICGITSADEESLYELEP